MQEEAGLSLRITCGALRHSITVPEYFEKEAFALRRTFDEFLKSELQENVPPTTVHLVALFMQHTFCRMEPRRRNNIAIAELTTILRLILLSFQRAFLSNENIHCLVPTLSGTFQEACSVLQTYYKALDLTGVEDIVYESKLMQANAEQKSTTFLIFGGQGLNRAYFEELRHLWTIYEPLLRRLFTTAQTTLQGLVTASKCGDELFPDGFDILEWLGNPDSTPSTKELLSAPLSCPLLGLVSLANYCIMASTLGKEPCYIAEHCKGATGHSQGIVIAAIVAVAGSWDEFYDGVKKAMNILFWIGVRSELSYAEMSVTPHISGDSVAHSEGIPSPMLSIRGLTEGEVSEYILHTNSRLKQDEHCYISLVNCTESIILSGPPETLYGLCRRLRKLKRDEKESKKYRIIEKRTRNIRCQFLPVSAPSHSPYLQSACERTIEDLEGISILAGDLAIPLFHTQTGLDLRAQTEKTDIVSDIIRMIMIHRVNWPIATQFSGGTHVIDFGPGGSRGAGALLGSLKQGKGVRIMLSELREEQSPTFGNLAEILTATNDIRSEPDWISDYGPRLVKNDKGQYTVDTKFSRIFSLPPVMVAGMHPTTVCPKFVSSVINAGYHTELAGGGYLKEEDMERAILYIQSSVPVGRGITCNLLYVSPRSLAWQIPMILRLQKKGVNIDGITIGGGVPSLEVANEYINTLRLGYIAFKPSSQQSIQEVLVIAQAHPQFPVILQWTGGRGGGHHSNEDFHEAIIKMYDRIRRCKNVILVAGSGFGGVEDTYAYLSGSWSERLFGIGPMPFDAVMLGSRVMTSKEAPGSTESKQAIVDAQGTDDDRWWDTEAGSHGIISVKSEWGQPMHMITNRGTLFWAEMDRILSLEKPARLKELSKRKSSIIEGLNANFQKPWFGRSSGEPVELEAMTYEEVLRRLVELMYEKATRWVDISWQRMVADFCRRIEARFALSARPSMVQSLQSLDQPSRFIEELVQSYPACRKAFMKPQDIHFFIQLCKQKDQKPMPFIPRLDEDFELWLKKDSLWQAQDLEAVIDEDVQRVAILQGPVAARYSKIVDEPIKNILNDIHQGFIQKLLEDAYKEKSAHIPIVEYLGGGSGSVDWMSREQNDAKVNENQDTFSLSVDPHTAAISPIQRFQLLSGKKASWKKAILTQSFIMRDRVRQPNYVKQIFETRSGIVINVSGAVLPQNTSISLEEEMEPGAMCTAELKLSGGKVRLQLSITGGSLSAALLFEYQYDPEASYHPIRETDSRRDLRVKIFYYRLWFGDNQQSLPTDHFRGFKTSPVTITEDAVNKYVRATKNRNRVYQARPEKTQYVPMDMAVVLARRCLMEPLFAQTMDGDLLKLVHLSIRYKMYTNAQCLRVGDTIDVTSKVTAIMITEHGKMVEVVATIHRDGLPIMDVISQVQFRGVYTDYINTFQETVQPIWSLTLKTPLDIAVLRSKKWITFETNDDLILGMTLEFHLFTRVTCRDATEGLWHTMHTSGKVFASKVLGERFICANVSFEGTRCRGNPVLDYLSRCASLIEAPVKLNNPVALKTESVTIVTPSNNAMYARASGDFNPIHTSAIFATIAELPGTITHGAWTCAAVRCAIEAVAADNEPERIRSFSCTFTGMVLPRETLTLECEHTAMVCGQILLEFKAFNKANGGEVLRGQAIVMQPSTSFLFTGQGSQKLDLGMDLYESSHAARQIWDQGERYFVETYGVSILDIVRKNPKVLTVHLRGQRGRLILQNYLLLGQSRSDSGEHSRLEVLPEDFDIDSQTIKFHHPQGLLFSTQFAQPALLLYAKAAHADMSARGVVATDYARFAGHSLGEYAALASMTNMIPLEKWLSLVFFRGLVMHAAIERDSIGQTKYRMVAVNPSKIGSGLDGKCLQNVVEICARETGRLLEVVNYNVEGQQYVCAGHVHAIRALIRVLDYIHTSNVSQGAILSNDPLLGIVKASKAWDAQTGEIESFPGVTPLSNIDIPFHSSLLRSGVPMYRDFLEQTIHACDVNPEELINRWIPNLTGIPFTLTEFFIDKCITRTQGSQILVETLMSVKGNADVERNAVAGASL